MPRATAFPPDWKSSIPVIPPNDSGLPLPPGYAWAGDRCQPQRSDSETYRRAVHLGEITPWGEPAVDGVAVDAQEKAWAVFLANAAVMHIDAYTQIHADSYDYDHAPFSQAFG